MSVATVKNIFIENGHKMGSRDCKVMGVSALKG